MVIIVIDTLKQGELVGMEYWIAWSELRELGAFDESET